MAQNQTDKTVTAYLRCSGFEGFVKIDMAHFPSKRTAYMSDIFLGRKTSRDVFSCPHQMELAIGGAHEIVVVYDEALQQGPLGLIKSPYLLLNRTVDGKDYRDLTEDHKADIDTVIHWQALEDDQQMIIGNRSKRVVMAYQVAKGRWSGIMPVVIAEYDNGNFRVPGLGTLFTQINDIKCRSVKLDNRTQSDRFFCIYDRRLHNNGTNECPYLLFVFSHPYKVQNMTEDHIIHVADIIRG